jgi:hypothetical protein
MTGPEGDIFCTVIFLLFNQHRGYFETKRIKEEKKLIENAIIAYYNCNSYLNNVRGVLKEATNCGCFGLFVLSAGSLILHESNSVP